MTTAFSPGLYRRDAPPPAPRELRTGIPAFLGATGGVAVAAVGVRSGPAAVPAAPGSRLAAVVEGFFGNGGERCVVVGLDVDPDDGSAARWVDAVRDSLAALDAVDEVDLLCLPDLVAGPTWPQAGDPARVVAVQRAVLEHCAGRGDRFAVLDAVPTLDRTVVADQRAALAGDAGGFGALYAPWLVAAAPGGAPAVVPPCGHVSGTYAAVDRLRDRRAPANVPLDGVVDVQVGYGDGDVAALAAAGVNPIRMRPGRGTRAWGARTCSDDPVWRDVAVRRTVVEIGRWLAATLPATTFEPHGARLWVRIERELTEYLEGLAARGALRGGVGEGFSVRCDATTNPPEAVDAGRVVAEVALVPAGQLDTLVVHLVRSPDGATSVA